MTRRIFDVLTLVSLLLCVAVTALGVRSYWRYDLTGCRLYGAAALLGSYRGHLLWAAGTHDEPKGVGEWYGHDSGGTEYAADTWHFIRANAAWNVLGFSYTGDMRQSTPPLRVLVTPAWSVALVLGFLPVKRLADARRRRRRRVENRCPSCGYDLRATPGRCPECGNVAKPSD